VAQTRGFALVKYPKKQFFCGGVWGKTVGIRAGFVFYPSSTLLYFDICCILNHNG
jgi:hypothetical protein